MQLADNYQTIISKADCLEFIRTINLENNAIDGNFIGRIPLAVYNK